ncbi:MAG: PKD domain-containing protein [Planctomycetota bacterium]
MKHWIMIALCIFGSVVFAAEPIVKARGSSLPPVITLFSVDANPAIISEQLTFSFAATTTNEGISYAINFGDGQVNSMQTGNLTGRTVTLNYTYVFAGNFTVTLSVSDGSSTVMSTIFMEVFGPNNGASGIPNISDSIYTITDPDTGVSVSLCESNGGVIQLCITEAIITTRAVNGFLTDWGDIAGRSSKVNGTMPVHKYSNHGVFIAKISRPDNGPNVREVSAPAVERRTLVLGSVEVGENISDLAAIRSIPKQTLKSLSTTIIPSRLRGRFSFPKKFADTVSFVGTIQLPVGFNTATKHELQVSIGNITGIVNLNSRGTGELNSNNGLFAKAKVFFPSKGGVLTKTQAVRVDVLMANTGLVEQGFDTEGISNVRRGIKGVSRQIQVGMTLDGLPYQSLVPVSFSVSADGQSGAIDLSLR